MHTYRQTDRQTDIYLHVHRYIDAQIHRYIDTQMDR